VPDVGKCRKFLKMIQFCAFSLTLVHSLPGWVFKYKENESSQRIYWLFLIWPLFPPKGANKNRNKT
jgi:hypothetical protein